MNHDPESICLCDFCMKSIEESPVKRYLGDSVYVELQDEMLKLTTENGLPTDPSNTIYLEPEVYVALEQFVAQVWGPK